ncbi:MAG TPA: hypothetical protein VFT74_20550 [Isosphaeraceae bacterium]|nr:hypothetical protein [Isosphaeraceae bacterium]
MNAQQIGLILRLLGPLIELVCAIVYFQFRYRNRSGEFLGWPVEKWCFVGVGIGLAVWVTGWVLLTRRPSKPSKNQADLMDTELD